MNYKPVNLSYVDQKRLKIAIDYIGKMHNIIPEGKKGDFQVVYREATEEDVNLERVRIETSLNFGTTYPLEPGEYTYLLDAGENLMSDTATEILTNIRFLDAAKGDILIGGLGLGIMPCILEKFPEVKSITILEKNVEVVDLVAEHLPQARSAVDFYTVIVDDIFEFCTSKKFDTIYFDIWSDLAVQEFSEMDTLENKFKDNLKESGWIGSWRQE